MSEKIVDKKIKCYISASPDIELTSIENLLESIGLSHYNFYDFSIGESFSGLMESKIKKADFVLALVNKRGHNVLFELGIASGMGKPIFLVADKNYKIPFFLENQLSYKTDLNEVTDLLKLSLLSFIEDVKSKKHTSRWSSSKDIKIKEKSESFTNNFIKEIRLIRKRPREKDLIDLLSRFFKSANISFVSEMEFDKGKRVDIVIRNRKLSPYFGSIILIEVKSGNVTPHSLAKSESQLLDYLDNEDAYFGIVLYLDRNNARFNYVSKKNPRILRIDIEDFLHGTSKNSFENYLVRVRNEVVHGVNK